MDERQSGLPFDDIRALFTRFSGPDMAAISALRESLGADGLTADNLGRLNNALEWLAGFQQRKPKITRPMIVMFAASHGIAASPQQITTNEQQVAALQNGASPVNHICESHGLGLKVFEMALQVPTHDITREAAMAEDECAATIAYGMEAIADGADLLCIGAVTTGNDTVAGAVAHGLFAGDPQDWAMANDAGLIEQAVALHKGHLDDPLEVLRRLGGRELAAMMGAIIAARLEQVPVVLDGYCACVAGALAEKLCPGAADHCRVADGGKTSAQQRLLQHINQDALLDLSLGLTDGSAGALAIGMVQAALSIHNKPAAQTM